MGESASRAGCQRSMPMRRWREVVWADVSQVPFGDVSRRVMISVIVLPISGHASIKSLDPTTSATREGGWQVR